MATDDGRLKLALAIAASTDLVTVNLGPPATVDPSDLFIRRFNDPKVGLDNEQMRDFKERLKIFLPSISADIDQIPENSNLIIEDVAEFVRLALLTQTSNNAFISHVEAMNTK
jgi:hypothetical protein